MKKDQNLSNKNIHSTSSSGNQISKNHYQIAQIIHEINHPIIPTTEVDHQIKEIHEIPHKIGIVDHIAQISITEIIIRNQIQADRITRLIPVPNHTLGIDTIQMIDQETHHTIDTEIIPTIGTDVTQIIEINNIIIDHEITL